MSFEGNKKGSPISGLAAFPFYPAQTPKLCYNFLNKGGITHAEGRADLTV
jgi:hypothetical protein